MKTKRIVVIVLVILVGIQLIRIDRSAVVSAPENDILSLHPASESVQATLKSACYDCHSNESKYPWYSQVAPISWLIGHHIEEGREHLNFSTWGEYSAERKAHKAEECVEEMEEGEMPMKGYVLLHADAKLTETQQKELVAYFGELSKK